MTEIIIGPAGSGKSTEIRKRIINDLRGGSEVIFIVPEQRTLRTERELCEKCQSEGVRQTELEVLNFKRLCNSYFRKYGGLSSRHADGRLRALTMWKAFVNVSPHLAGYREMLTGLRRFVPVLLSQAEELRRYGIKTKELSELSKKIWDGNLSSKVSDCALIVAEYNCLLEAMGNCTDEMGSVAAGLESNRFFEGRRVYVDGFDGFTPEEKRILGFAVRQAEQFTIALTEGDGREFFAKTDETIREIKASSRQWDEYRLAEIHRPKGIRFLLENFGAEKNGSLESDSLQFVRLYNPYVSAEFIAADIIRKCRDEGARLSDFAVVCGNEDTNYAVLDAVLSRHGIRHHSKKKKTLRDAPLYRLVISVIEIKRHDWRAEDVISLLKSGLLPLSATELSATENYIRTWGIRGAKMWLSGSDWEMNPNGFATERRDIAETLETVNGVKKKIVPPLCAFFEICDRRDGIRDIAEGLYKMLTDIGAKGKTAERGGEDARLWNGFCEILDLIVGVFDSDGGSLFGDGKATDTLFFDLFDIASDMTETGFLPAHEDEVVLTTLRGTKIGNTPYVYLFGCNEGIMSPTQGENGIFTDDDKVALEDYGIVLSPRADRAALDTRLDFLLAACSASVKTVFVAFCAGSGGEVLCPCAEYTEALTLSGGKEMNGDSLGRVFFIQDEISVKEAMGLYGGDVIGESAKKALGEDFDNLSFGASEDENFSNEFMSWLFGGKIGLSSTAMNKYLSCGFSYACAEILRLGGENSGRVTKLDEGNFVHYILECFFRELKEESPDRVPCLNGDDVKGRVDRITENYFVSVLGENGFDELTRRAATRFIKLKELTIRLLSVMLTELSDGGFIPTFFETKIGWGENSNTVKPMTFWLEDGETTVTVRGKIDRIDIAEIGGELFYRIVDYKTGSIKVGKSGISGDVINGGNLQMPLYLFTVESNGAKILAEIGKRGKLKPAGLLYYPAKPKINRLKGGEKTDSSLGKLLEKLEPVGAILDNESVVDALGASLRNSASKIERLNSEAINAMREDVERAVKEIGVNIAAGKMGCNPQNRKDRGGSENPCDYCEFSAVCKRTD